MPVTIIGGYPCRNCGCWSVDQRTDCTYFWVNFGTVLVEEITNYICRSCKCVLIQVINHKEEKDIYKSPAEKRKVTIYEY